MLQHRHVRMEAGGGVHMQGQRGAVHIVAAHECEGRGMHTECKGRAKPSKMLRPQDIRGQRDTVWNIATRHVRMIARCAECSDKDMRG
jgi:hypothetical protein